VFVPFNHNRGNRREPVLLHSTSMSSVFPTVRGTAREGTLTSVADELPSQKSSLFPGRDAGNSACPAISPELPENKSGGPVQTLSKNLFRGLVGELCVDKFGIRAPHHQDQDSSPESFPFRRQRSFVLDSPVVPGTPASWCPKASGPCRSASFIFDGPAKKYSFAFFLGRGLRRLILTRSHTKHPTLLRIAPGARPQQNAPRARRIAPARGHLLVARAPFSCGPAEMAAQPARSPRQSVPGAALPRNAHCNSVSWHPMDLKV